MERFRLDRAQDSTDRPDAPGTSQSSKAASTTWLRNSAMKLSPSPRATT